MTSSPTGHQPTRVSPIQTHRGYCLVLVDLVAVAIGWFFRPWLHGLIYTVYTTPLLLLGIVAGSVAAWVTARSGGRVEIVVNTLSSSDHTITPPVSGWLYS